jgi:hypothetical protein
VDTDVRCTLNRRFRAFYHQLYIKVADTHSKLWRNRLGSCVSEKWNQKSSIFAIILGFYEMMGM